MGLERNNGDERMTGDGDCEDCRENPCICIELKRWQNEQMEEEYGRGE